MLGKRWANHQHRTQAEAADDTGHFHTKGTECGRLQVWQSPAKPVARCAECPAVIPECPEPGQQAQLTDRTLSLDPIAETRQRDPQQQRRIQIWVIWIRE